MVSRRLLLQAAALPFALGTMRQATAQRETAPLQNLASFMPTPDQLPQDSPQQLLSYLNLRSLLDATGLDEFPRDFTGQSNFIERSSQVPLDSPLFPNAMQDWTSLIGFGPADVEQIVTGFQAPNTVRVYQGSFDPNAISSALGANDYVDTMNGEFVVFSGSTGDNIDLSGPLDSIAPGAFHYVAVTERNVITTNTREMLDLSLAAINGESFGDVLADDPLTAMLVPMTGCYLFDGEYLSAESLRLRPATDLVPVPPAKSFAAGITMNQDENLTEFLIDFENNYVETILSTITDRIETGISLISAAPLSELFGPLTVENVPDSGIVRISGSSDDLARRWQRAVQSLDLAFIATE